MGSSKNCSTFLDSGIENFDQLPNGFGLDSNKCPTVLVFKVWKFKQLTYGLSVGKFKQLPHTFGLSKFKQLPHGFGLFSWEFQITVQRFWSRFVGNSTKCQTPLVLLSSYNCPTGLVLKVSKFKQLSNGSGVGKFKQLLNTFGLCKFKQLPFGFGLEDWEVQKTVLRSWSRFFGNSNNCSKFLDSGLEKSDQVPNGFGQDSWAVQRVSQHF